MSLTEVDRYAAGADALTQAIAGLSSEQISSHPVPGKWSLQELVLHMLDADLVMAERMKRVISEENPTLLVFDPDKWAQHLGYSQQSASDAATLFALNRRMMAQILLRLPASTFERTGTHSQRGRQTLAEIVKHASWHLEHHLKFADEKRNILLKQS